MRTYFMKMRRGAICWRVVDAENKVLGRLAARAVRVLMGKDSPDWTPHADHRDGLIVINAEKIRLTGRKLETKLYRRHSGYPGGLKEVSARHLMETKPDQVLREAIVGMLPKNRMGERLAKRLRIYAGSVYPHQAQTPEILALGGEPASN